MTGYLRPYDPRRDQEIVAAIKEASFQVLRAMEASSREGAQPVAFVVTTEQWRVLMRSVPQYDPAVAIPSATLWGIQVLVADEGWACPSNLTDLRGVTDA
jgi:hypothetical protein